MEERRHGGGSWAGCRGLWYFRSLTKKILVLLVLRFEEGEGVSFAVLLNVEGISVALGAPKGWPLRGHGNKRPRERLGRLVENER